MIALEKIDMNTIKSWPLSSSRVLEIVEKEYRNNNVLVTGGASFIGSHLVDALLTIGCKVRVIDDLSSGLLENLDLTNPNLNFIKADILKENTLSRLFVDIDKVFHLAAIHGGRGFIESNQSDILSNIAIDNIIFNCTIKTNVPKITYASSACAYPISLQSSSEFRQFLSEENSGSLENTSISPDGIYGWSKLIGEKQLKLHIQSGKSTARAARIFTAYGERENESHAAIALIAKSLLEIDPFPIWGNGEQTRNFTYVTDTVAGLLLTNMYKTSEKFALLNIGTSTHTSVNDFVEIIFNTVGWHPKEFKYQQNKPTGVASRASDNTNIKREFDWEPNVELEEGIFRTVEWYKRKNNRPKTIADLNLLLESR